MLCEHGRIIERSHNRQGRTVYDWRHYLAVIQRKPGALRNGAPFADLPEAFKRLRQHLLKRPGGDREMVEILALVLQHDEQAVLCAVELALSDGAPTKTHILNVLHRLIDGKSSAPPTVDTPQALNLVSEPRADVERYDTLRGGATRPRPNSRVTSRQIDHQARIRLDSSPESLESTACDPCVMDRVFRISMPEIVLDQPKIVASVGEIEAAGMA